MEVHYFFRNQQLGYSIHTVFQTIMNQIKKKAVVKETFLPSPYANMKAVIRNGIYAIRRRHKGEVNHITGDVHYLTLFLSGKQTIVTVHDIMYYHYLHGVKKWLWKVIYIYPLKRAAYITFISEFAKQQVLEVIHLQEDKMKVIPDPVSPSFRFTEKEFHADKPVILHIGTQKRKNLRNTILALRGISCQLRIIGDLDEETIRLIEENHIDYSQDSRLTDSQIIQEYRNADIVNFPSLFEGFGMPIIEGQMTGRVVVTSNLSPMKDVAGDGALLVNPRSVEDMHEAYLNVINDEKLRDMFIEKGRKNVSRFAVENIAEQYMQIYKSILSL